MTHKITPGPWVISDKRDDKVFISSAAVTNRGNANNGQDWVCSVWVPKSTGEYYGMGHLSRGRDDYERGDANAFAIANLPELLKRCRDVLGHASQMDEVGEGLAASLMLLGDIVYKIEEGEA